MSDKIKHVETIEEKIEGFNPTFTRHGHVFFYDEKEEYEHFTTRVTDIFSDGAHIVRDNISHNYLKCNHCGKHFKTKISIEDNTVEYCDERTYKEFTPHRSFHTFGEKFWFNREHYPTELIPAARCASHKILHEDKMMVSEIDVPTGELVFVNFFSEDENHHVENEYAPENSICHVAGLQKLMTHLASRNIGFGQMGNMSIGIFTDGDQIVIGDEYEEESYSDEYIDYDPELYEKAKEVYKDLKLQGSLCLEMWRWCCADKSLIKSLGEENNLEQMEQVIVNVPKGRYRIEHYYGIDRSQIVYSRLMRIGD